MKPVLYLDIDGVLLANETNLAEGASDFIKYASDHFDVYWLTTHCMDGDAAHAIDYVLRATNEDLRPYLETFKPTTWSLMKTEAIDSWIEVDLAKYPDQMVHELKLLQSMVKEVTQ